MAPLSGRPGAAGEPADDPAREPDTGSLEGAVRVDVAAAMGLAAEPIVAARGSQPGLEIRWLDAERALVIAVGNEQDATPVVLGQADAISRTGAQRREVVVGGWRILADVEPERGARLRDRARRGREDAAHSGPIEVRAIIPGRVVAVSVAEGDHVEAGGHLLVIESMKMQNELRSPRRGTVERIAVGVGQTVDLGALLVVLR
jgi:biotin carboxyl carrier protein